MSYAPTEWKTGDVVTALKLNNIEDELVKLDKTFRLTFKCSANAYKVATIHSIYKQGDEYNVTFYPVAATANCSPSVDVTLVFNCKDATNLIMDITNCVSETDTNISPILEGDASLDENNVLTLNGDATITFAGSGETPK